MRALFASMPRSIGWFLLTGIIFLLQWFPFTGIFLMLVAAPFWSIATINLGFFSIVVEVLFRRIPVAWLAMPLAWFGGYAGAAFLSQQRVADLDAQVRAINAGQRVTFAPDSQALVFNSSLYELSGAAAHFVREYRVPVAFQTSTDKKNPTHRASRVVTDPLCQAIRDDRSYGAAGIHVTWFHGDGEIGRRQLVRGMCMVSSPENPELPAVVIEAKQEKHAGLLTPHSLTRISIYAAGGGTVQLVAGSAEVLSWLPMPYMGCALNSGAPSWDCFAGFWRKRIVLGSGARYSATMDVVGAALGLERVPAANRREEIAAVAVPSLSQVVRASSDQALATLDAVIADPTRRITVHDVPGLADNPALLGDRPARMVEAFRRAVVNGRATYETSRVLQDILARLPGREFDPLGPALLEAFKSLSMLNDDTVAAVMAARLGNLGAPALGVLERLAFSNPRRPFTAAVYGLCRLGADAAPLAERIAVSATPGDKSPRDYDTAAYVALMRMGRDDIVAREKTTNGRFMRVEKRVLERQITAASPPSACVSAHNWPRVPD